MSSTLIAILVSIVVALCLLISFFVGRKRGVKRTLLDAGLTLAFLILAFFLTPIITNAFMGISLTIGKTTATAGTFVSVLLMENKDIGGYIKSSKSLQAFLNGIIPAILSVIVFVILCLVFKLIEHIIYKIIERFGMKSKDEEEEEGILRNKLGGGILSAVKTFLFIIAIFLPFTSLLSFTETHFFDDYAKGKAEASSITDVLDELPTTKAISNEIPSGAKKAIAGYNNSVIGWVGGLFGIDDVCFDYLSQIDVNGNKVSIRQTADSMLNTYDYILDIYKDYKKEPVGFFKELDYEQLDKYKKELLESGMFKGFVLNVVYDYSQNYEDVLSKETVEDIKPILEDVKAYLKDKKEPTDALLGDIYKLLDVVKVAGTSGFLDDVNKMGEKASAEDIVYLVLDKYTNTFASESINSVLNIGLVRSSFASVLDEIKDNLGDGKTETALKKSKAEIENWEQFIYDLKDIVTDAGDLYHYVENAGIDFDELGEDVLLILKANPNAINPVLSTVGAMLDKIDNLELTKDLNNEKILNDVLDSFGFGDLLKDVETTGQTVTYSYVFNKLGTAVQYLLEYDLYDEIKAEDYVGAICKIGDAVYADSLLSHGEGVKTSQEKLEYIFKTLYDLPRFKELTIDEFADSLDSFVDIKVLDEKTTRDVELRYMTDIIIELSKNKITAGGEEQTYLRYLLTEGNDFEGLIDSIEEDQVEALLTPILKSKMTKVVCDTIFDTIKTTLVDATGNNTITLTYSNDIFNATDDQTAEVCEIFKKFIEVHKAGTIASLDDIPYDKLGLLLDSMKSNAYRYELASKPTTGIFKNAFDVVISEAEEKYNISFKKAMNKEWIYNVPFAILFDFVQAVEDNPSEFTTNLKKLISEDNSIDKAATIKAMFDSINSTNYGSVDGKTGVIHILKRAEICGISIDVTGIEIDNSGVQMAVTTAIDTYEFDASLNAQQITELKTALKQLLK